MASPKKGWEGIRDLDQTAQSMELAGFKQVTSWSYSAFTGDFLVAYIFG